MVNMFKYATNIESNGKTKFYLELHLMMNLVCECYSLLRNTHIRTHLHIFIELFLFTPKRFYVICVKALPKRTNHRAMISFIKNMLLVCPNGIIILYLYITFPDKFTQKENLNVS